MLLGETTPPPASTAGRLSSLEKDEGYGADGDADACWGGERRSASSEAATAASDA